MRVTLATFLLISLEFLCHRGKAQSNQCKENEEYQECASGCPLTCQNYREPFFCTVQCKSGCFCRSGYVKGPGDKCIRPSECPIGPCKDGEVESTCINPCNNCIQKGKCYFEYCIKGCDCRPGYYRNSTGTCVIADKCGSETHLCPPHEHYTDCVSSCNDCWFKGHCHADESWCSPGCECNPGYFRDDYGTCIPENRCGHHDECGANEVLTHCVNSCNDCEHKGYCDHHECQYGCDCKPGFFRNHEGHCISESECAAIMCGHYEEYSECGSACPISCDSYNKEISCIQHCVKGCFCTRGYIRGPNGTCIRPTECPRVCGEYEEYSECGTSCPLHCSNITTSSSTPCSTICVKGCFCKAGYVRGPNGKCILQSACPLNCGEYEEYRECGPGCIATCENRAHLGDCSLSCTKGCFCTSGYIRGPSGKCILPETCPPVCGRNEEYQDCGSACPANCTNSNPKCREVCVRGCFCKPGYIRDPYGICVLPTNCPLLCDEKEIFMSCGPRCEPSCDAIHRNPALCPGCQKGCFCKPGFVRGPDGKCLLPISCPAACGENEEFNSCGSACPANCRNRYPNCSKTCVQGCFCKPGFIRSSNNSCILPASCPIECYDYEEFKECGSSCPSTCTDRNPTCTSQCVRGCFCKAGYIKDSNGKCVLPSQCPQTCPENETYRLCGTSCPITCHNIGKSVSCRQHCVRGCFCNDGYVRGPNGTCITPELCPMRCEHNEVLKECGTACQLTCANHTNPGPCAAPCVRGCFCKRGYVRNVKGKCISSNHCPTRCKEYEVFTCSVRSCEATCDDDDDFSRPCTDRCTNGCYCRTGFLRAPDGNCVQRSRCPREINFDGRNKGEEEGNDTDALSSNRDETKSSLTSKAPLIMEDTLTKGPGAKEPLITDVPSITKAPPTKDILTTIAPLPKALLTTKVNLDLLTKLDEALPVLPVSLPIVDTLLDEEVSTPANAGQASLSTALSSISATKETSQLSITEKPTMAVTTNLPQKSSDNPTIAMEPMTSQTPIQSLSSSKQTSLASTELKSSTLPMSVDSTSSAMIGTTV
ncbi:zonadhesin-like [Parasteatoda tepidariorum]|uniref:zonadhesin-like n=1 Tax=Parasteatoda tepidariorum TaxID=114398 RepID=UPI00077F8387|nr:zonadhesin-like [Parasteatoda tepidariorum]